jgi:hypothetical protein
MMMIRNHVLQLIGFQFTFNFEFLNFSSDDKFSIIIASSSSLWRPGGVGVALRTPKSQVRISGLKLGKVNSNL